MSPKATAVEQMTSEVSTLGNMDPKAAEKLASSGYCRLPEAAYEE